MQDIIDKMKTGTKERQSIILNGVMTGKGKAFNSPTSHHSDG